MTSKICTANAAKNGPNCTLFRAQRPGRTEGNYFAKSWGGSFRPSRFWERLKELKSLRNGVSQRSYLEEIEIGGYKRKVRLGKARKTGRGLACFFVPLLKTYTILVLSTERSPLTCIKIDSRLVDRLLCCSQRAG